MHRVPALRELLTRAASAVALTGLLGVLMALLAILWQFRHAVPMNPADEEFAADHVRHRQNRRTSAGRR